jgi:hypothetical protein
VKEIQNSLLLSWSSVWPFLEKANLKMQKNLNVKLFFFKLLTNLPIVIARATRRRKMVEPRCIPKDYFNVANFGEKGYGCMTMIRTYPQIIFRQNDKRSFGCTCFSFIYIIVSFKLIPFVSFIFMKYVVCQFMFVF